MAYVTRTKDDPGDVGRAADQQQSVDNEEYLHELLKYIEMVVFWWTSDCEVGDGAFYFHIPADLDGFDLTEIHGEVITAGVTNTMDIQIHNVTSAADMLSTKLTIDTAETGSDTAAVPAVINAAEDDVAENDLLRVDIDAVHDTPAKGFILTLGFGE